MMELWQPDDAARQNAQAAYMRYTAGVAIANNPMRLQALHGLEPQVEDQRSQLLQHIQGLMWAGLKGILEYAHPPSADSSYVQRHYDDSLPFMIAVADDAAKQRNDDLNTLNPYLATIKPMPLIREPIYRAVAHSRRNKLKLIAVMDAFTIHASFGSQAGQSTFEDVDRYVSGRSGAASKDKDLVANLRDLGDDVPPETPSLDDKSSAQE